MPRVSPWDARFARPAPRTLTVELPELETQLTLQEATDDLRRGQIWDRVERYCFLYVGADGGKPRQVLNGPGGAGVLPTSRDLFQQVAAVEVMQVVAKGETAWSMLDLVGVARNIPPRWEEIKIAVAVLSNPPVAIEENPAGNSPEVITSAPSDSSPMTSEPTPNSSTVKTTPSA